jgi:hypothetical protein
MTPIGNSPYLEKTLGLGKGKGKELSRVSLCQNIIDMRV